MPILGYAKRVRGLNIVIKGVNRQMIEVTHTGSPYFERAFLLVRSGAALPPQEHLHSQAEKVVQKAGTYSGLRRGRWLWRLQLAAFAVACSGVGAVLMWGIQRLMR